MRLFLKYRFAGESRISLQQDSLFCAKGVGGSSFFLNLPVSRIVLWLIDQL